MVKTVLLLALHTIVITELSWTGNGMLPSFKCDHESKHPILYSIQQPPVHARCTQQGMPIVIVLSPGLRVSLPTVGGTQMTL